MSTASTGELAAAAAFCETLSREPDFDAPELQAYDAADLLLLAAARAGSGAWRGNAGSEGGRLVVIGDRHGALTLGAAQLLDAREIRVHQDPLLHERALDSNAERLQLAAEYSRHPLGEELLCGVRCVLIQLPRSLAELDELAWHIARWADPTVTVFAGGRDKHMSRRMNDVLARYFTEVTAGRGWRKARVLTARGARPAHALGDPRFPVWADDSELNFRLASYGATFGGSALDHGSRLLLRTLREYQPNHDPRRIVDLGCGNGVLGVFAALRWQDAEVIASDQSAAAVAATALTARAAGVADRVRVVRADATESVPQGWADLLLLNPPFHAGATVHAGVGQRLIRSCATALAPGGELRLVYNSQLNYRALVGRVVGPTEQLARDTKFTVVRAHMVEE